MRFDVMNLKAWFPLGDKKRQKAITSQNESDRKRQQAMESDRKMKKQVWKSNLKGEKYEQRESKKFKD